MAQESGKLAQKMTKNSKQKLFQKSPELLYDAEFSCTGLYGGASKTSPKKPGQQCVT